MVWSAVFESLTGHTLLIRFPGEGRSSTLTCKRMAYVRGAFLGLLALLHSPGWDCVEQSSGGQGGKGTSGPVLRRPCTELSGKKSGRSHSPAQSCLRISTLAWGTTSCVTERSICSGEITVSGSGLGFSAVEEHTGFQMWTQSEHPRLLWASPQI